MKNYWKPSLIWKAIDDVVAIEPDDKSFNLYNNPTIDMPTNKSTLAILVRKFKFKILQLLDWEF